MEERKKKEEERRMKERKNEKREERRKKERKKGREKIKKKKVQNGHNRANEMQHARASKAAYVISMPGARFPCLFFSLKQRGLNVHNF